MKNPTWTYKHIHLEKLPCGTIHLECTEGDGSVTFDRVDKITVQDDTLCLECSDMVWEFPFWADTFLAEAGDLFPVSKPTPVSRLTVISGTYNKNGKPIDLFYHQDGKLQRQTTTPAGDLINTVITDVTLK